MAKVTKIIVIVGSILLLLLLLGGIMFMKSNSFALNNYLNKIVRGEPDKSCFVDSDCKIAITDCGLCGCGEAVNINWKRSFCPIRYNVQVMCMQCPGSEARCLNNKCVEVFKNGKD